MQNLAQTSSVLSPQKRKDRVPFDMDVCFLGDAKKREEISTFIRDGYKKAFDADISVTMPALLYIEEKNLKAALGMRGGKETFFVQQYLDKPVIECVKGHLPEVAVEQLVEIGSLYSNSNRFTIPLFMVTAVTAYLLGKKALILCGTEHVLDLLTKSGVKFYKLADAKESHLQPSLDDWGTYYQTNPQVVAVSVDAVMALIEGNKFYKKLFNRLAEKIEVTCSKLAGKL
jgi:hypothetical protein